MLSKHLPKVHPSISQCRPQPLLARRLLSWSSHRVAVAARVASVDRTGRGSASPAGAPFPPWSRLLDACEATPLSRRCPNKEGDADLIQWRCSANRFQQVHRRHRLRHGPTASIAYKERPPPRKFRGPHATLGLVRAAT